MILFLNPTIYINNYVFYSYLFTEHHINTSLNLVGLQVWRGALLLADYLLHCATEGVNTDLKINQLNDIVLELGAGTGLTSIVAAMVAKQVVSTGNIYQHNYLEKF